MASQYRIERDRGTKDSRQQFAVLREKWPLAFPVKHQDIRLLAVGVAREIAATMGWSHPYTLGILHLWKMAPVYCQAVFAMTNASPLTACRPKRSMPRRRTWRPSSLRGSRRVRPRRKQRRL